MRNLCNSTERLKDFKEVRRRNDAIFAVCLMVVVLSMIHPRFVVAGESDIRLFAAHALVLRASAIAGEPSSSAILAGMPGSGPRNLLPPLWGPFFENTVVRLGRLQATTPVALYYNPLLDVAVFTLWEKREEDFAVVSVRALPGERLLEPETDTSLRPQWMEAGDGPILALPRIAQSRLVSFQQAHPEEAETDGTDDVTFAAAAVDLRAALPRLVWNTVQRDQWTTESFSWLLPTLTAIEAALAIGDAIEIRKAAPGTDPDMAEAIARLPAAFLSQLTLDMVLRAGETEHLLVGSLTRRRRRLHADHLPDGRRGLHATTYFYYFLFKCLKLKRVAS